MLIPQELVVEEEEEEVVVVLVAIVPEVGDLAPLLHSVRLLPCTAKHNSLMPRRPTVLGAQPRTRD